MAKKSFHVPEELINEILLRSPVKSLLRCKCVCKSWFCLISNPNFASSQFQLAASPTNKLICLGKCCETISIDFNASLNRESSYASLSHNFLPLGSCPEIGGSCRGFIFLHCDAYFYLWNPSTGVQKKIPASPITISIVFNNSYLGTRLYGFAYDHSTDDYLIVLGSYRPYDYEVFTSIIYFEIFSLRANKWKHIEVNSHMILFFGLDSNVRLLLNDSIHWMVSNDDTSRDFIAFDLKESRMSEIPLPYDFHANHYNLLLVHGEHICAPIVEMHTIKIWVMKKYAVHSTWTKILEFSVDPALHCSLFIVCFTNCGDIIRADGRGGLMKFNDKGQLLEHSFCDKCVDSKRSQIAVYTESMLSLPCDIEQV